MAYLSRCSSWKELLSGVFVARCLLCCSRFVGIDLLVSPLVFSSKKMSLITDSPSPNQTKNGWDLPFLPIMFILDTRSVICNIFHLLHGWGSSQHAWEIHFTSTVNSFKCWWLRITAEVFFILNLCEIVFLLRQVSPCSPGWPRCCYVDQPSLNRDLFASLVLELNVCTTVPTSSALYAPANT